MALESADTDRIEQGDLIEVNYLAGEIKYLTKKERYACTIIPEHIMEIIDAGGLVPYLAKL